MNDTFFQEREKLRQTKHVFRANVNRDVDHSLCTQNSSFDGNERWSQTYYAQFPVCNVARFM